VAEVLVRIRQILDVLMSDLINDQLTATKPHDEVAEEEIVLGVPVDLFPTHLVLNVSLHLRHAAAKQGVFCRSIVLLVDLIFRSFVKI
jgi:hypothetical protein